MSEARRIGVLGVGNVLVGDDGIGPFVLKILESHYEFPPGVEAQVRPAEPSTWWGKKGIIRVCRRGIRRCAWPSRVKFR